MKIPARLKKYYEYIEKDNRITLKDDQTKLYIKAKEAIWMITVDGGIITNDGQSIRKCDYMICGEVKRTTHLIELKGKVIDEAYKQLKETIKYLMTNHEVSYLIKNRDIVDAYIVSPNAQKIPKGLNSHERELAKSLAAKCKLKPLDIFSLINYVKVVPKQAKLVIEKQHIICSGQAPVEFE